MLQFWPAASGRKATRPPIFKWRQTEPELILCAVCGYLLAAAQGDAFAQYNLGFMYGNGRGVLKDSVLAHMWFNIAGGTGHGNSKDIRESLEQVQPSVDTRPAYRRWRVRCCQR